MEELKILVNMVASLPQMALWVVVLFFIYKVSIVGSIYGVIRYVTSKLHDWAITKKTQPTNIIQEKHNLRDICIVNDGAYENLIILLNSLKHDTCFYLHNQDIKWLQLAIEEKKASDLLKTHKTP